MTAVEISEFGGPEVLKPVERATPVPGPDEVLIAVAAAGVNRPDSLQRQGRYPPPPGASDIPGLEVAGRIVEQGSQVSEPRVGTDVCALVTGGGYAQYCVAAATLCLPIPRGLSLVEAAGLPECCFTVWANVFEQGGLKTGDRLLVHGGSGGIGTTAIQLARAFGAEVFATAGSYEKCALCRRLGAESIAYHDEDFVDRIGVLTGGRGVDLILDIIGGDYLQRNLSCLGVGGRLLQIGVQHGPVAEINLLPLMLKRLTVTGSTLRSRTVAEKSSLAQALRLKVWPKLEAGAVKPIVHTTFPLREAAAAHRLLESGGHFGKIVLTVD